MTEQQGSEITGDSKESADRESGYPRARMFRPVTDITGREEVEARLRTSEERYRSIFDNAIVGIYRTTPDGRILTANQALVRMLGHDTLESLTQRNLEEAGFEPGYPRTAFKELMESEGKVVGLESAWTKRDGTRLYVRENARAIRDERGHVRYYEGTAEDITEPRHTHAIMSTLAETALDLLALPSEADILGFVCEKVKTLIGEGIVAVHSIEGDTATIRRIAGLDNARTEIAERLLRVRLVNMPTRGLSEEIRGHLLTGRLHRVEGGLYELFFHNVPKSVCETLTATTELMDAYLIGLRQSRRLFGDVTVLAQKGTQINVQAIETLVGQASMALERLQAQEAAETGRAELQSVFDSSPNAILIADLQGNIRACNHAAMDVLGCSGDQIVGRNFLDFVAVQDHIRAREDMHRVVAQNTLKSIQYSALRANGSPFVAEASTGVIRGGDGQATALVTIATDVTEREWAKAGRRLSHQILEISNQHVMRTPMLRQIVLAIQEFAQCEAVGIRILDKNGGIPYEAYTGFSREFYETESPLSIENDHCMCINVIRGETDPSLPFYTSRGSFYMNDTTRFLATVSEQDKGRTRNVCNETGFESVALIPIRSNDDILGLIHLADSREHRVPLSLVETIENVAMQLGVAVRRAMVEEALRKSEERFRAIVDNAAAMVAVTDAAGRWIHVNQYMLDVLGYSYEELSQICAEDILLPEDRLRMKEARERLVRGETQQHRVEVRQVHKNGRTAWVDLSVSALHDEQGRVEALLGVGFNITDQKNAVDALQLSERKFRAIADYTGDVEAWIGPDGQPIWLNPAIERFTGYTVAECMAMPDFPAALIHPDDRPRMLMLYQQACAGTSGNDILYRLLRRDGSILWVSISWQPIFGVDGEYLGLRSSHRDVTDRIRAEEELRQSESALRAAQKVAHVGSWTWHIATNRLDWSDEMYRIFGIEKKDFSGDLAELTARAIHPRDRAAVERVNRLVIDERRHSPIEFRIVRPDGSVRTAWAEAGELTLDKDGNAAILTGIVQDITDRKNAQQALAESEERYRLLFDQMLSGLALHEVVYDAAGNPVDYRFLSVNAAFERMTGLRAGEILGKTVLEVMPGIERFWIERYARVASTGEPVRFEEFTGALNRYFDVRAYSPRRGQFAVVFHDITDQKLAEQREEQRQAELRHVSRLSTLGEMASGLAHELNQPLSAIMSFASACLRSVQKNDFDPQQLAANLGCIVTQSSRAGDIIRRIRAFVQRRPPKFESVDINESIREVQGLLHSNIRSAGVEVVLELARDLPPILGDTIQLEQVLVNLMRNAIEAMEGVAPRRRRLTVRTAARSRDSVTVIVSDTGPGMDEKTMARVFDPFFTTKENGLGIGLSISRSIIESHRGHLSVAPGPEGGCAFTFTLPASGVRDGPAEPRAG